MGNNSGVRRISFRGGGPPQPGRNDSENAHFSLFLAHFSSFLNVSKKFRGGGRPSAPPLRTPLHAAVYEQNHAYLFNFRMIR